MNTASRITIPELEVIYWRLEDALEDGERKHAVMFHEMLLYVGKYHPSKLRRGMQQAYLTRLKEITYELNGSGVPVTNQPAIVPGDIPPVVLPYHNEAEMRDAIVSKEEILYPILGSGRITAKEIKINDQCRVDILYETDNCVYPIELKVVPADHKVVGQYQKYCYYFYRKLRYNMYRSVQGVVVANGFSGWVTGELMRRGAKLATVSEPLALKLVESL